MQSQQELWLQSRQGLYTAENLLACTAGMQESSSEADMAPVRAADKDMDALTEEQLRRVLHSIKV